MVRVSHLREKILGLNRKRRELLERVLRFKRKMVSGSLYQMSRACGNPNCKCAQGKKHVSWYLSRKMGGKTKLVYVGRMIPVDIREKVKRYRDYQGLLSVIRKIDQEISESLNGYRDGQLQEIERMKTGR